MIVADGFRHFVEGSGFNTLRVKLLTTSRLRAYAGFQFDSDPSVQNDNSRHETLRSYL